MDSDGLVYIWRPVAGGRHAFAAAARRSPVEETVVAYCGAESAAAELHGTTELDWIMKDSCMACWRAVKESS